MEEGTKKKIACLSISILVASILTIYLYRLDKTQVLEQPGLIEIQISENITKFEIPITNSPTYFSSVGKVHSALASPYIRELKVYLSLDEINWIEVSINYDFINISNQSNFKEIGYINLNQIRNTIYGKVPLQDFKKREDVSKEYALANIQGHYKIEPTKTKKDKIILFLVFITVLGTSYSILYSFKDEMIGLLKKDLNELRLRK